MKNTITQLPGSEIDIEVTLDQTEFNAYWKSAYDDAVKNVSVKGFRPGMAPQNLADAGVNREKVFDEAVNRAVRESLHGIRDEKEWSFIDTPKIEVLDAHPIDEKGGSGPGLKYKAHLVLFPEVTIGDYRKIAADVFSQPKKVSIEPDEIEKTLEWLRDSRATLTRVTRPAALGDLVELDVESTVGGKALEGGALKDDKFVLGKSRYIPGFDEALVGHSENKKITFSLTTPADYWKKDLQNAQIDFSVHIKAVFERALPELNDEFAARLGPALKTMAQVKENIEKGLLLEKEEKEKDRLRAKVIEEIIKTAKVDVPKRMLERTLDGLVEEVKEMSGAGLGPEYTDEKLREDLREKGKERVLAHLVIYKIAKAESLEPTEEEVNEESKHNNLDPQKYYDYSYGVLQNRKVFQFLENSH